MLKVLNLDIFIASYVKSMPTYTINQILNLQHGVTKTVTMSNAINSPIAPIEFYDNFMVYVDSNNYIYITNLSSGLNVNTTLIFNNVDFNAYYGLIIHNNYLYLYYINNNFLLYVYSYTLDNLVNINLNTLSLPDSPDGNLGFDLLYRWAFPELHL